MVDLMRSIIPGHHFPDDPVDRSQLSFHSDLAMAPSIYGADWMAGIA
jgi:hypothetical protein